ncbi:MAG: M6 family metalloprotease domain-containing protein [Lentisphaerae bacterium]|nr:M6 family metalloprotease domain-containing protein [Lentisphaerota bacterium]
MNKTLAAAVRILVVAILVAATATAAPFAQRIRFKQPDGASIELWGEGDEFSAVFETLDGYAVVFDHAAKSYQYARLSADGNALLDSGLRVGQGSPAALGLTPHLRINPMTAKARALERRVAWEKGMDIPGRWKAMKAARRDEEHARREGAVLPARPSPETTGTRVGLCLLIDFDDDPATVPQSDIVDFCNGDAYTGFGNNGSVKKYFQDNSGGLLTYSNVVTAYVRIPNSLHPKSYYVDVSVANNYITNGQHLIRDALTVLKALPNYTAEILPTFEALTVDANTNVVAFNVFFAGGYGDVWLSGLNPHSYWLDEQQELSAGGKKLVRYQISHIGASLGLSIFCHENGHMLCNFPDVYDYELDSYGGAGAFSLMSSYGGSATNPVQFDAYLKWAAGWATLTELTSLSSLTVALASAGPDFNRFYRFVKPGVTTEYFIVENRLQEGRDLCLPASGVAVWHVDELGDHNNQSLAANSNHANYELTLVQADNQWHFQNRVNYGDSNDLYHSGNAAAGYGNQFTDSSSPNARWWDGTASGARFLDFSASATTVTATFYTFVQLPDPTLISPTGGENYAAGDPVAIQWSLTGTPTRAATRIEYRSETNSEWTALATTPTTTSRYDWTPPEIPGAYRVRLMFTGTNCTDSGWTTSPAFDVGTAAPQGDYDGDGRSDLAIFDSNTGFWYIRAVSGATIAWAVQWGWPGAAPVGGDYDGDGTLDMAVFDGNTGYWYIRTVAGATLAWAMQWGWPGAAPVGGDYDGDGRSDLAIFDQMTGNWYIRTVSGTIFAWATPWGWPGAETVSGDYDGDRLSDLAVFDQNTGAWFIRTVSGTTLAWAVQWGWPGAVPVNGDYDGDGLDDLGIFDSNTGYWYVRSIAGAILAWEIQWGWPGAVAVAGDYDGDGIGDLAIFDQMTGNWYIRTVSGTIFAWATPWGWPGANPVR